MQSAKEYLRQYIIENNLQYISPEEVVELASDPYNPLHEAFQWDDEKAGHAYRVYQARVLIKSIKVHSKEYPAIQVPLMVSVPSERGGLGYQRYETAVNNPKAREELRQEIIKRVHYWSCQIDLLDPKMLAWLEMFPEKEKPFKSIKRKKTCTGKAMNEKRREN